MGKNSILIVDDDLILLKTAEEILSSIYTVSVAKSGKQAITLLKKGVVPDLIVNKDNTICYVGGNWGTGLPTGKIVKILKNGKKYSVSYDVNMKDTLTNTYYRYMGRLKITLKKAKNKNGFVITDIKRVRTENVNI